MEQVRFCAEFLLQTIGAYLNVLRATWAGQLILYAFIFAVIAAMGNRIRGGKEDK